MKNRRMSTMITIAIFIVVTLCIFLLYLLANQSMTSMMKESAMKKLQSSLDVEASIIKEYIAHQEDLLISYSNSPLVIDFLKNPGDEEKQYAAQRYTEKYYSKLNNWEGLYIGEWNTHVIAHSNPQIVGMTTRKGEPLRELQKAMLERNGLYNAGIIVSPASQRLILSMYCPVFDNDGKTILGYVGGGPFVDELRALLASVESSTATYYLINAKSQMYIFAQNEQLMTKTVQDKMLLSVVDMYEKNAELGSGSKEYIDEEGNRAIAAYDCISEYDWIVVSCNREDTIYANVNKSMSALFGVCIFSIFLICLLSWLFIRINTRPLKYVERAIVRLQKLKLEKEPKLDDYIGRKSEVGQIATAIDSLYDSIGDMLEAEKEKQMAIAKSESKANFVASMSHEIRTPINTVLGMNEMILRENKDEVIQDYANNIKNASQMLLSLVNDVLDFSKMEAGKIQIVDGDYRLVTLLRDAIHGVELRFAQKDLAFHVEVSDTLPTVLCGDEIRIKQILNNLLTNAAKYTEKGSVTLSVRASYEEDFILVISVTDTGIGIRKDDLEHLFESFMRLEIKKNRHIEGTGLGLSITKQLVDNMKGTIYVESEHGKGSCFTVRLPQRIVDDSPIGEFTLTEAGTSVWKDQSKDYFVAPGAKVLVVDDNKINLTIVEKLLKRSQMTIETAVSGEECLEKTKNTKYNLILMDHMMPKMDGVRTLHHLREDAGNPNQNTEVIALTANAFSGVEEFYTKEGFSGYLSKPIMVDRLEEMLARFLS